MVVHAVQLVHRCAELYAAHAAEFALFSVLVAVFNAALADAANTYNQGIATDQATAGAADQAATDAYNSAAQTALNTESTNDQTASW